ncbi:putative carboxylesterase 11 [Zea mays]|jgi:hypothetical protein|uniref:Putative carboxylesterase 11 n=1 Tax=Zea mays TaxID=4577 RepID=A0A1D6KR33_MAIZE|nr:putative carboxylesterase 11 [Zea mays]
MPSVGVKIYIVFFKLLLRHRLQSLASAGGLDNVAFGVSCRPDEATAPPNPAFSSAASKDLHIDPNSSLSVCIFLPTPCTRTRAALATPPRPPPACRTEATSRTP